MTPIPTATPAETPGLDWRARLKNPAFWVLLATGLITRILAARGLAPADLTDWPTLLGALAAFAANPYELATAALYLLSLTVDPTTKGLADPAPGAAPAERTP